MDVVTEGGAKIKSKENYVDCTVSLSGTDGEYCFDKLDVGIRGRGNTTWRSITARPNSESHFQNAGRRHAL